ncbi:bifunctional phosphoserine phosphatase/homoserine phosphotransferase ThrH [Candidatus Saccharibacteria bacterium]|nr:bifunctional phosphoserine phosphatase/homoserine phosphotransferase ThrH [Candidatus Saccharibacteria bacterium]
MHLVCLDLEGVLVPEVWIAFAKATKIPELQRTTKDEPDYDKLMRFRLDILAKNNFKLADIQQVISKMNPLPGALEFSRAVRERTQLIILSGIFEEFTEPLMAKLGWPTIFCNSLEIGPDGTITGYQLRQKNDKKRAVQAFQSLNIKVFAAGDSFNDLEMIDTADAGYLFRAPANIRKRYPEIPCLNTYDGLLTEIDSFLESGA